MGQHVGRPDRYPGQIDVFDKYKEYRLKRLILPDYQYTSWLVEGEIIPDKKSINCDLPAGTLLIGVAYSGEHQALMFYFYNQAWPALIPPPDLEVTVNQSPLVWDQDLYLFYMETYHPEKLTWRQRRPLI